MFIELETRHQEADKDQESFKQTLHERDEQIKQL